MAKPEWGSKRTCQSCATVFYDFQRDPIVCPSCGATVEPEPAVKSRRSRTEAKPKPAAKPVVVAEPDDDAAEQEEDLLLDDGDDDAEETASEDVDTSLVDNDDIDVDIEDDDDEDDTVLAAENDDDDDDVKGIVDTGDGVDDELTK